MTNKLLGYIVSNVISIVILVLVVFIAFSGSQSFGGTTNYDALDVSDGYYVDGVAVISGAGSLTLGSGGTAINKYKCYTDATFDPASISSSSAAATQAFLTPSATTGDIILASLNSVTSTNQWFVTAKVTAGSGTSGATTTLYLRGTEGAAVNLSTTTAKVCIIN